MKNMDGQMIRDYIPSFVRGRGRFTKSQRRAYQRLYDKYCIPFREEKIDIKKVMGFPEVIAEIGFGMGMVTAEIAERNPHMGYLGIEVYKPGVGKLLSEIARRGLRNIKIVHEDAVKVIAFMIPSDSLKGVHIFFPDPWPKKRHHKRRLIKEGFASLLCSRLEPGGYVYITTDWEDYARQILLVLSKTDGLENAYDGFAPPQDWRPTTRFEKKGYRESRRVFEILFKKI